MPDLMIDTIGLVIASVFFCAVMAGVVWLRVKPSDKLDKQVTELRDRRTAALLTQAGQWASFAVNVVIGVLLGVAINGLVQLMFTGAWVAVFNLLMLAAALFLIVFLHKRLGDKLFPSGIRPARKPEKVRKTPLMRGLGLPAGLVVGVVLASLGLDDWLLGWRS